MSPARRDISFIAGTLAIILLTATPAILGQVGAPERVAEAMVAAASSLRNWATAPGFPLQQRTPEQTDVAIKEWSTAFKAELGEEPSGLSMLMILAKTRELYDANGVFQPSASSQHAGRITMISKERLVAWRTAVAKFQTIDDITLLWFMLRQGAMFRGRDLTASVADRQLARLSSLPGASVTKWAHSAGVQTCGFSNACAAFALIQVDPLFDGSTFKAGTFETASPIAEKLIQKETVQQ